MRAVLPDSGGGGQETGVGETMKDKIRATKHISFTPTTFQKLEAYLEKHYGNHRALSMVVDKAVEEYLDRHKGNGRV